MRTGCSLHLNDLKTLAHKQEKRCHLPKKNQVSFDAFVADGVVSLFHYVFEVWDTYKKLTQRSELVLHCWDALNVEEQVVSTRHSVNVVCSPENSRSSDAQGGHNY